MLVFLHFLPARSTQVRFLDVAGAAKCIPSLVRKTSQGDFRRQAEGRDSFGCALPGLAVCGQEGFDPGDGC